ncbi:unnamed protein product [Rotaria sp. Silwood2]|nr:unnamed protein product [Rotaria sp. Silwood2]CAF4295779.1 unnamed protein product [Rotaria sp. Silwood2]
MSEQHDLSQLGVITVVFNPVRYEIRYKLYFEFKEHMARSGINLTTVECIFPKATKFGLPEQKFEVTRSDNPHDIQIIAPSVMWIKENLINIAAQRLPKHVRYTIDKTTDEKIYWKCESAQSLKCKGRIHTNSLSTIILHETNNHNHLGKAVSSEIRIFEEKIRDRAINYNESTQTVIDNCLMNLSDNAVARIPNFKHIKNLYIFCTTCKFCSDWPHLTIRALQQYPIVQLFKVGFFNGSDGEKDVLRTDYSFGYSICHNKPIARHHPDWYAHPGYAWAMHRNAFDAIGGLLDFCIVGPGDLHFAYALLGRIHETYPCSLGKDYQQSAEEWGNRLATIAGHGANVGYVNTDLFHRWHGSRESRGYNSRWSILIDYQYSPVTDLRHDKISGVIDFNSTLGECIDDPRIKKMKQAMVNYFISRNEDTTNTSKQESTTEIPMQYQDANNYPITSVPNEQLLVNASHHRSDAFHDAE